MDERAPLTEIQFEELSEDCQFEVKCVYGDRVWVTELDRLFNPGTGLITYTWQRVSDDMITFKTVGLPPVFGTK